MARNNLQLCGLALALVFLLGGSPGGVLADRSLKQTVSAVRLCLPAEETPETAANCTAAVALITEATVTCVFGNDAAGCEEALAAGTADITKVGGDALYTANTQYGFVPIASEYYGDAVGTSYFGVAIMNADECTDGMQLADLKGKRSCHTGYRKTAGWAVPVGALVASGAMPVVDNDPNIQNDAESVAAFFSEVCAPRVTPDGPTNGGTAWDGLCSACKGDCTDTAGEPYQDYPGTFRGLVEGACDVAFTKHTTAIDYAAGGKSAEEWGTRGPSSFALLCPSGGCKPIDQYASCHLANNPAHAWVATPAFAQSAAGKAVAAALVEAAAPTGNGTFLAAAKDADIVQAETLEIKAVTTGFEEYFGKSSVDAFATIRALEEGTYTAPSSDSGLSSGAIAGIVIGTVVGAGVLAAAAFFVLREVKARKEREKFFANNGVKV